MKLIARFEHPTNARYYEVYFGQDLFGHWCITTIWGRKNTELGKIHHSYPESMEKAQQQLKSIQRQREKRQYQLKGSINQVYQPLSEKGSINPFLKSGL